MKKTIQVNYLARVEGEGGLTVVVDEGQVKQVELRIFEPPRFFEAFLEGRDFKEAPDITSRICGICPIAYQMSAVSAMENALGIEVPEPIRLLRRLIYCGEWIESHSLHIYLLHAPDFLGFESAIEMAKKWPEIVQRGLSLKKAGNHLMSFLGGREIHPINVRVGGFYRAPARRELAGLEELLSRAKELAAETVEWVSGFSFPEYERDYLFFALNPPDDCYPIESGGIQGSNGLRIEAREYESHFFEEHKPQSTALHSHFKDGSSFLVGPLARFNLAFDKLSEASKLLARRAGLVPPVKNPFKSIIVRAIEVHYACEEALRIIKSYVPPAQPFVEAPARAATGHGCTEAPRGLLYHRYDLDADGSIRKAKIVPPTSQNQTQIEGDLRDLVQANLELSRAKLGGLCEQTVRNYDPCISCAAHFLKLKWEET